MTSLFGIPLEQILAGLAVIVVLAFLVLGWIAARQPLLVRMGLRNAARRKTQTVLIVIGLMLSTLIISAAFATGDTVAYSITNTAFSTFRNVDVVVGLAFDRAPGTESLVDGDAQALRRALGAAPEVDGVTGMAQVRVPVVHDRRRLSEPNAALIGLDPATVDAFDALRTPAGEVYRLSSLPPGNVLVSERMAREVGAGAGDALTVYFENRPTPVTVAAVVQDNLLTSPTTLPGPGGAGAAPTGGVVTTLEALRAVTGRPDRLNFIAISGRGGVRDTLPRLPAIEQRVQSAITATGLPLRVGITKAQAVSTAELLGSLFVTFFVVFGLFSMAAGVMLIFLTFVMLAAERRSEMGIARAVGMQRLHLTQSFVAEGMAYNVGSALVGALLGLGVAYGLVSVMGRLAEGFGLNIVFHFNPVGFAIAYCVGVVLTFITVAFASWRAANLNIVRAIRDLPEPQPLRGRDRGVRGLLLATVGVGWYAAWPVLLLLVGSAVTLVARLEWWIAALLAAATLLLLVTAWPAVSATVAAYDHAAQAAKSRRNGGGWAAWMLLAGLVLTWLGGWVLQQEFAYSGGITLTVLALAMLTVYFGAAPRPAFTVAGGALVWYWLLPLPFSLLVPGGEGWRDPLNGLAQRLGLAHPPIEGSVEMFFVAGISVTAAATLLAIFNADLLLAALRVIAGGLGGVAPAVRTAIAYPLASKFRTAMTLAMFALVMFSLVVMATLNFNFTQVVLGPDATGGFDVAVLGNQNNRIPDLRAALRAADGRTLPALEVAGTLTSKRVRARAAGQPSDSAGGYAVQGADDEFLRASALPLAARAAGYDSDAAVWEALRRDPALAVVDETRLAEPIRDNAPVTPPFAQRQFRLTRSLEELRGAPWQPLPIVVRDPANDRDVPLQVIAIVGEQGTSIISQWRSVIVNAAVVRDQFGGGESESFYLVTEEGTPEAAKAAADAVEAALLEKGVQASSIQERIEERAGQAGAFQMLFQGFMGLGLIVGIAALGVIAFRSVAERRQQIGMLRAIGYTRRLVALSFFLESSFIALTGIGMGLLLGAALSYNIMTSPEFTNGVEVHFAYPWGRLALIVGVAYVASALMTLIPARSASRVPVAEALRYQG